MHNGQASLFDDYYGEAASDIEQAGCNPCEVSIKSQGSTCMVLPELGERFDEGSNHLLAHSATRLHQP